MKALTIKQPFAHLIITPQAELNAGEITFPPIQKRVENRTKAWKIRGTILVHAGISTDYINPCKRSDFPEWAWGAIVGTVEIVDCVPFQTIAGRGARGSVSQAVHDKYPWLWRHAHAEGPYCLILENPVRLAEPVPCRGSQGWWRPPADILDRLREMGVKC